MTKRTLQRELQPCPMRQDFDYPLAMVQRDVYAAMMNTLRFEEK